MTEKYYLYKAFELLANTRNSLDKSFQYSVMARGLVQLDRVHSVGHMEHLKLRFSCIWCPGTELTSLMNSTRESWSPGALLSSLTWSEEEIKT